MEKYTRSAPGKQGGVEARRTSEQEIFVTRYAEGIVSANVKKIIKKHILQFRIHLALNMSSARQSNKSSKSAASVLVSLLGVNGSGI